MLSFRFFRKIAHFLVNLMLSLITAVLLYVAVSTTTYPEWSHEAAEGGNDSAMIFSLIALVFLMITVISWTMFLGKSQLRSVDRPR